MSHLALICVVALGATDPAPADREESGQIRASEPPAPAGAPLNEPAPALPSGPAPAPSDAPMDFDLLGPPAPSLIPQKSQEDLDEQVRRRRTMLQVHQALGFATLAGLIATEVVGQLDLNDKYRGGGDTGRYQGLHLGLALGTTALFTSVGLLGLLAPVPYAKKPGFSTATLHKMFMALAAVGMLTEVALGFYTGSRDGHLDQRAFAQAHQVIGYGTLGAVSLGAFTFFF